MASGCKRDFPRGTQPRTRVGRVCMRREPRGSSERAKYVSSRPVQGTPARQDVKEIIVSRKCLSLAEKTDDRVLEVSLSFSLPSSVQLRSLSFFSLCPPPAPPPPSPHSSRDCSSLGPFVAPGRRLPSVTENGIGRRQKVTALPRTLWCAPAKRRSESGVSGEVSADNGSAKC